MLVSSQKKQAMTGAGGDAFLKRPTILCVEDDADLRGELVQALQASKYAVIQASNGAEAVVELQKQKPDLILCDVTMPFMGGVDLLHLVRQTRTDLNDVPFVFLADQSDREGSPDWALGADDWLDKPVDPARVLTTVQARLAQVARMRQAIMAEIARERSLLAQTVTQERHNVLQRTGWMLDSMSSGFIVLDEAGQVQILNRTAEDILGEKDGLILSNGQLSADNQRTKAKLRSVIRNVLDQLDESGVVMVPRERGRPLLLQVSTMGGCDPSGSPTVAVFVQNPEKRPSIDASVVAQMYGLTRTEAKLAIAIASGDRVECIANAFGISQNTVAFHLQNLFRKTQTSRQTDLVALLIRSALAPQTHQQAA